MIYNTAATDCLVSYEKCCLATPPGRLCCFCFQSLQFATVFADVGSDETALRFLVGAVNPVRRRPNPEFFLFARARRRLVRENRYSLYSGRAKKNPDDV